MKTDLHPDYQAVVFRDLGSGETFLTRSTVTSDKTMELVSGDHYFQHEGSRDDVADLLANWIKERT